MLVVRFATSNPVFCSVDDQDCYAVMPVCRVVKMGWEMGETDDLRREGRLTSHPKNPMYFSFNDRTRNDDP